MIRRVLKVMLLVFSVLLALSSMVSHWHAWHVSEVWNQGGQWVDFKGGSMHWSYESNGGLWQDSVTVEDSGFGLPYVFGFRMYGDGHTRIYFPGIFFDWWRQSTGYRRFYLRIEFFTLACVAAAYPTIAVIHGVLRHRQRRSKGLCLHCGYDLTGNESGKCSECGESISEVETKLIDQDME